MSSVVKAVTEVAIPILGEQDSELVEVEFVKEGESRFLRVFIDREGDTDIEECALVSEKLSEKPNAADPDPIPRAYFLEVSSPGVERSLKKENDYEGVLGDYVYVSLYQPVDDEKQYGGSLQSPDVEQSMLKIRIKTREKELTFD